QRHEFLRYYADFALDLNAAQQGMTPEYFEFAAFADSNANAFVSDGELNLLFDNFSSLDPTTGERVILLPGPANNQTRAPFLQIAPYFVRREGQDLPLAGQRLADIDSLQAIFRNLP